MRNLKKSLMQKLFTEGLYGEEQKETEIGFIPKSWKVVRLGEVAEIQQGKTPKRKEYHDFQGFRIIKVKDFEDGGKVKLIAHGERSFTTIDLGKSMN